MRNIKLSFLALITVVIMTPFLLGAGDSPGSSTGIPFPESMAHVGGVTMALSIALCWLRSEMQQRVDSERSHRESLEKIHLSEREAMRLREETMAKVVDRLMAAAERGE